MVSDCERVAELLGEGFIPVLHGDGVLDDELGCTVLSGDKIIQVGLWLEKLLFSFVHASFARRRKKKKEKKKNKKK